MNRIIHFLSTSRTAVILLLATLLTATAAQTAWADDVAYLDANGAQQTCSTYTTVTNSSTSWSCGNCDVCHTPPQTFDGTELVQKALSAILRTGEQVGFTLTIDILHGNFSPEVVSRGYNQIKTFAAGRDVPVRDWHDYLLQMLQMGYIEIAYNEDNHLHVTQLGQDIVHGKTRVQLVVISREDFSVKGRRKQMMEEQVSAVTFSGQSENKALFEWLKELRKEIADEINYPAFVVMSDKTLHALATDMPTTLETFGNTFGIGEHKRDTYGKRFIEVIKQYAPAEVELPFKENSVIPVPKEEKKKKLKLASCLADQ